MPTPALRYPLDHPPPPGVTGFFEFLAGQRAFVLFLAERSGGLMSVLPPRAAVGEWIERRGTIL